MPGSDEWSALEARLYSEFLTADEDAGAWATVGGFLVATNLTTDVKSPGPLFERLMDKALVVLRDDGVAWAAVPPFASDRWTTVHGCDGVHPAGWPGTLAYVPVPTPGEVSCSIVLAEGESAHVATRTDLGGKRDYFAERREGRFVAVIEGVDPDDGQLKRWDWSLVNADSLPEFLRELGDRLITPTTWAHGDLLPYFPCRDRTRDEMRLLARAAPAGG